MAMRPVSSFALPIVSKKNFLGTPEKGVTTPEIKIHPNSDSDGVLRFIQGRALFYIVVEPSFIS